MIGRTDAADYTDEELKKRIKKYCSTSSRYPVRFNGDLLPVNLNEKSTKEGADPEFVFMTKLTDVRALPLFLFYAWEV
jgi:hypothetical protein